MAKTLKAAVLGGGWSAQTMAADLALHGLSINLFDFPQFADNIAYPLKMGTLEKYGSVGTRRRTGLARLALVTTELEAAVRGVDVIFIAVPAYAHMHFFEALAPLLKKGQTVVILPGNWGAMRLRTLLDKRGLGDGVHVAETNVCAHICRADEHFLGPGRVRVIIERSQIGIAAIPSRDTPHVHKLLKDAYPELVPMTNVIETSLRNGNIIGHGPLVLMNTGWLEHTAGDFMIYRDGLTPSVGSVIDAVSAEQEKVVAALGLPSGPPATGSYEKNHDADWVRDPCEIAPPDLQNRYLSEDMPFGLTPLTALGDLVGVSTPCCDAMVTLASVANGTDYRAEGLTLDKLGLAGLDPSEIMARVA